MSNPPNESDAMRREIADLLEESRRIRERSEDLARRIADLRQRIERDEPPADDPSAS